jgi:hypothetical protein
LRRIPSAANGLDEQNAGTHVSPLDDLFSPDRTLKNLDDASDF